MKLFYSILLTLCLISPVWADGMVISAIGTPENCALFFICQNNETATTGWDNSEVWTTSGAGVYPAYTTTPIRGTQSLYINDGTSYALSPAYTATGEIWGHFRFQTSDGQPANQTSLLRWGNANLNTTYGSISITTSGYLYIVQGTGNATASTDQLPNGATGTYHVWFHWKKGTGANGQMEVYISTGTIRPGSASASLANGSIANDTVQAKYLLSNPGSSIKFDQTYLSNSDNVGTVAE